MSDALGRITAVMDKYAERAASDARSDVAGKPFNLMAVDDVARVMDAKGGDLVAAVSDALQVVAASGVEGQKAVSDAMSAVVDALGGIEGADMQPVANELQRLSQSVALAGDKSRNGQAEIVAALKAAMGVLAKMQAAAKDNSEAIVLATERNTKALEKVAGYLGADKAVDYDDNGRPATIRVAQ